MQPYWSDWRARRLGRRRLLAVGGVTAMALTACRGQNKGGGTSGSAASGALDAPQPGGTYNWYLNSNPNSLDPQKSSQAAQAAVTGVYSRVFAFKTGADPAVTVNHELENDLGVSAESPDAITWTIKLRPDAKFQNIAPVSGHAVEAEDVKATFTRAVDPATVNPNRGALDFINAAQIQTPDKQTVVFKLNYPYAPFRSTLASPAYSLIFPREALTGSYDPAKVAIGSGPFTLDSATPDVAFLYKKNADWYAKGRPYVDGLRMAIVPDPAQQLAQFSAGNVDDYSIGDPYQIDQISKQNPKAQVIRAENIVPNPIYFQLGDPTSAFLDIRVRRAFSMAIDRDVISRTVYNGQSEQMVFVPSYLGKWALRVQDLDANSQQYYKYNPAQAKQLLQAAGATDLQLKITYANSFASPTFVKQAGIIADYLKDAGVKTTQVMVDFNKDWIDSGKGIRAGYYPKDTIVFATQGSLTDADDALFGYFDSKSTSNEEHLSDATMDAMIAKERTLVDDNERLKAILDIQRYLAQQMFCVSTIGTYPWVFAQPRVQNYQYSSTIGRTTETYANLWLKS
jgi:peptide/nickel transport system substrate-binding protein